jgi:hypothetical protein
MAAPEVQADVETSDMKTPESADVAAAAAADADAGDAAAAEPAAAAEEEAAEASDGGGGGGEAAAAGSLAAVEAAAAAWFDRKVFTKPDFDASRYVDEMSPYVSRSRCTHLSKENASLSRCFHWIALGSFFARGLLLLRKVHPSFPLSFPSPSPSRVACVWGGRVVTRRRQETELSSL